ncbi:hypothetical protein [Streptomyces sp. NPDC007346]|uniref:hypothetical protein n=1 Tax=Streptomyces sp. NPDC007346 TaxID=3154682 RepID=UPI0034552018
MLNPMIRWEPGTLVRYHGSLAALHGVYTAHRCDCHQHDDQAGTVRFALKDEDGTVVAYCVRPKSITPAVSPEGP